MTFPNGVFSGTIISSVIKNGDIKKTAEWQLLLGALALPGTRVVALFVAKSNTNDTCDSSAGVFVGAYLCNVIGRRNTVRQVF